MKIRVHILFILGALTTSCSSNGQSIDEQTETNVIEIAPEKIIATLDSLHFFDMTPTEELDSSKLVIENLYSELQHFDNKQFFDSIRYVDFRFYWLDGEKLFEGDGLISYLKEVKPTFEKLGLKLNFNNEEEQLKKNSLNHSIYINGTKYDAFNGVFDDLVWGHAAYNFALMLNTELKKQGSQERVYLISGGNDGRMVFLTNDMYNFIKSVYPKTEELPLEINAWRSENGIN